MKYYAVNYKSETFQAFITKKALLCVNAEIFAPQIKKIIPYSVMGSPRGNNEPGQSGWRDHFRSGTKYIPLQHWNLF